MEHSRQQIWLREVCADRPVVLRARSLEVQASAARAGVGIALLPNFYGLKDPALEKARFDAADLMIDIWLVVHEDLRKEAPIRSLMDFLVSCFPSETYF
jgi:DNA-binding transcriptional LysR family regulator